MLELGRKAAAVNEEVLILLSAMMQLGLAAVGMAAYSARWTLVILDPKLTRTAKKDVVSALVLDPTSFHSHYYSCYFAFVADC